MSFLLIILGIRFTIYALTAFICVDDRLASFTGFVLLCIGIALVIIGVSWNCGG